MLVSAAIAERALDISGFQSPALSAVLLGVAAIFLILAIPEFWHIGEWARRKTTMSLALAITVGSAIGATTGYVWWKLNIYESEISNGELSRQAIELARQMRDFETEHKNRDFELGEYERERMRNTTAENERHLIWQQHTANLLRRHGEHQNHFRQRYLGRAIYLRDEMLRRLNEEPDRQIIAFDGMLAGPSPVSDAADYLERSARRLPNGEE